MKNVILAKGLWDSDLQAKALGDNIYAMKSVNLAFRSFGPCLPVPGPRLFSSLFNGHYSFLAVSVYYPSAGMIAWSVRRSGCTRNQWFLAWKEFEKRFLSGQRALGLRPPGLRLGMYLPWRVLILFSDPCLPGPRLFRTLLNGNYSVPAVSVYYLSAGMMFWSVRKSCFVENRWFLAWKESET